MLPRDTTHLLTLGLAILMIASLSALILLQPAWAGTGGGTAPIGLGLKGTLDMGENDPSSPITVTLKEYSWSLSPLESPVTKSGTLNVAVAEGTKWTVAASANPSTWKLTKCAQGTSNYNLNVQYSQPLHVIAKREGGTIDLSEGGTITGTGSETINLDFVQVVTWDDHPLESGFEYKIDMTFTLSTN